MTDFTALSALCELIVDCEHKTAPLASIGYPSIRTPNIGRGRLLLDGVNRVDEETYQRWTRRAVPQADDLIIAREAPVGNVAIIPHGLDVCLGQRTVLVRPNAELVDPRFLCFFLLGDYAQARFHATSTGSTVAHLNMRDIRNLPVPTLPPIDTQRRIAAILGAYDDLIEVNRRRVAVLEEMARGLFEEWFVRFRFPGHENVPIVDTPDGPLPEGWTFDVLGKLADIQWGDTSTTKKAYTSEGYRAYSASGPDGYMPKFDYDRLGVVLSAIGAKCGKTWLARGQWSCIKNTMRFWAHDGGVGTEYLYLALSDPDRWPKRGAAQPFISLGDARKIKIVKPDKATSERFGAMASGMLKLTDCLSAQNVGLAASRDLLLPRLISGQLSVEAGERDLELAA